jgi:hypothetical protein
MTTNPDALLDAAQDDEPPCHFTPWQPHPQRHHHGEPEPDQEQP